MAWTSRRRLLAALDRAEPDRLPATTHHLMPYFLGKVMGGASEAEFFDRFGLDAIRWSSPLKPDPLRGQRLVPCPLMPDLAGEEMVSDEWQIEHQELPGQAYPSRRFRVITPGGTLTTSIAYGEHTTWQIEPLIKAKADVDLIARFAPDVACDVQAVNAAADELGERGIVRGAVASFPLYGQPGCWQDAACLVGIERLILETYDDPGWVKELLGVLLGRKRAYVRSLAGACYDLVELGGGSASTTVISPRIFDRFVAPYDAELIALAHEAGQRVVYHTCGGMMPILEAIADMQPDAMETFTPPEMGGDVDLAQAKRRIGHRACMIGGLDQFHSLWGCSPEETRAAVRRCFRQAGEGGGYILAPSDHFFDADPDLLAAFAHEAHACTY